MDVLPAKGTAFKMVVLILLVLIVIDVLRKWGVDPIATVVNLVPGPRPAGT